MQVKNSRYISEILYNAYQRDPNLKMDEASFREIVKSVTGGNCFSSPGSQLLLDYEDWKKTQPSRLEGHDRGEYRLSQRELLRQAHHVREDRRA